MPMQIRSTQGTAVTANVRPCIRRSATCKAFTAASSLVPTAPSTKPPNPLLVSVVEALFKFPPFFESATQKARSLIIQRSEAIGLDWEGTMSELQKQDWEALMAEVQNTTIQYPSYYTQPFHAYKQGNLCWQAALEFPLSSQSVHAPVMDPDNKKMDPEGDYRLRSNYGKCMLQLLQQLPGNAHLTSVKQVLDLGCATGLSSLALTQVFPAAQVTGVDLSPHMVAVGRYLQQQREAESMTPEPLQLLHHKAEDTGLPDDSFDIVSMCLMAHELPQHATKAILKEAYRVLRPGGAMCIMEMDPATPSFQRVFSNVFAYTAFKSTEPWLVEYVTLDLHGAMQEAGFLQSRQLQNSPRHKTVVAQKPL
eukprot:GHRR01009568.1.p1 GENE.GHRR01009568.1~~GHRR01009568.1.p1  ORF type:complete len:365 (+),score=126.47 GHRR01009568.1:87-1181(+)